MEMKKYLLVMMVLLGLGLMVYLHMVTRPRIKIEQQEYKIYCNAAIQRTCNIWLSNSIDDVEKYSTLLQFIASAERGDVLRIYLAGNGGLVNTYKIIANTIKQSKATSVAIVVGNVYSAHAFLALSMDNIIIGDNVVFLFHRSSLYGMGDMVCRRQTGLDRTVSKEKKCVQFISKLLESDKQFVSNILAKVLTRDEILDILKGEDLILSGETMKKRLRGIVK